MWTTNHVSISNDHKSPFKHLKNFLVYVQNIIIYKYNEDWPFLEYLGEILVFMWNSALWEERLNFYFQGVFLVWSLCPPSDENALKKLLTFNYNMYIQVHY